MNYTNETDSKKFYFNKQEDYSKYRPEYPIELFELLTKEYNIKDKCVVELGAGTGKFSKLVSGYCKKLYYVEPNIDMITKGKEYCSERNNIIYVNKSAENTEIPEQSVDIVFAVQSFHWFDKTKLKKEMNRILKDHKLFAIVWNNIEDSNNEFSLEYFKYINNWKTMLTGKKYQHKNIDERKAFFKDGLYNSYDIVHSKNYSLEMLIGLSRSLSFAPKECEEYYDEFINGVIDIFNKYQENNFVRFDFHTEMYIGNI